MEINSTIQTTAVSDNNNRCILNAHIAIFLRIVCMTIGFGCVCAFASACVRVVERSCGRAVVFVCAGVFSFQ